MPTWLSRRPARLDDFRLEVHALEKEELRASLRLAPLVTSPGRFKRAAIEERAEFATSGMVRVLCAEAHKRRDANANFSLLLASTAYILAKKIENASEESRRMLIALAPRERANALHQLGRFNQVRGSGRG